MHSCFINKVLCGIALSSLQVRLSVCAIHKIPGLLENMWTLQRGHFPNKLYSIKLKSQFSIQLFFFEMLHFKQQCSEADHAFYFCKTELSLVFLLWLVLHDATEIFEVQIAESYIFAILLVPNCFLMAVESHTNDDLRPLTSRLSKEIFLLCLQAVHNHLLIYFYQIKSSVLCCVVK